MSLLNTPESFSFKKLSDFMFSVTDPVRLGNRTIGVNLAIFEDIFS